MKNFGLLIVLVVSLGFVLTASAATTKEQKKKMLEKLRSALNTSETEAILESIKAIDGSPSSSNATKTESVAEVKPEEPSKVEVAAGEKPNSTAALVTAVTAQYMANVRLLMKRVMEVLGLRGAKKREGRNNRMMEADAEPNTIELPSIYRDEVRATVGAALGDNECIQQVACVAGSKLKQIKGKQIIFALLEKFSPTNWKDAVRTAKNAAILESDCEFKCLEG